MIAGPPAPPLPMASLADAPSLLVHEALIYATPDTFVAVAEPFLRDGLARGEAAFVATTQVNEKLLRRALGDDADPVRWTDADAWFRKPVETIRAYKAYIDEALQMGALRVRIIGEPVWPTDSPVGVIEWERYESILNLLLAPLPAWVICPYDTTRVTQAIIANAHRTHPLVLHGEAREASARYLQPGTFFAALDDEHELSIPPSGAQTYQITDRPDAVSGVRRVVVGEATSAGLGAERIRDLELVAAEIAANAIRYGDEPAGLTVWVAGEELLVQVADAGPGMDDRLTGYTDPAPHQVGGWGMLLARTLCDGVQVRTGSDGTLVRVRVRLPAR